MLSSLAWLALAILLSQRATKYITVTVFSFVGQGGFKLNSFDFTPIKSNNSAREPQRKDLEKCVTDSNSKKRKQ